MGVGLDVEARQPEGDATAHVAMTHGSRGMDGPRGGPHRARRAGLFDVPIAQEHHGIGERECLGVVVGDMDDGEALGAEDAAKVADQLLPQCPIERTHRFIEQQHLRIDRQRPSERDPLSLSPRERLDRSTFVATEVDQVEQFTHPIGTSLASNPVHAQAVRHVVPDVEMGEQRMVLEHHPDGTLLRSVPGDVDPIDRHRSGVEFEQSRHHPKEGRFPTPRRSEDRHDLARGRNHRDLVERSRRRTRIGGHDRSDLEHHITARRHRHLRTLRFGAVGSDRCRRSRKR